ncbi:hypothetical protein Scep_001203 [Stephania cephalantha]|uniref:Uncharacterized protein n=1 Tax=Stephania cephalantha TaxID=152367 RepID=A0AAP0Q347_9MAGN
MTNRGGGIGGGKKRQRDGKSERCKVSVSGGTGRRPKSAGVASRESSQRGPELYFKDICEATMAAEEPAKQQPTAEKVPRGEKSVTLAAKMLGHETEEPAARRLWVGGGRAMLARWRRRSREAINDAEGKT